MEKVLYILFALRMEQSSFKCFFHHDANCQDCNIFRQKLNFAIDLYNIILEHKITPERLIELAKLCDDILIDNHIIERKQTSGCWTSEEIDFLWETE